MLCKNKKIAILTLNLTPDPNSNPSSNVKVNSNHSLLYPKLKMKNLTQTLMMM